MDFQRDQLRETTDRVVAVGGDARGNHPGSDTGRLLNTVSNVNFGYGKILSENLESLREILELTVHGVQTDVDLRERAQRYDWDAVADQAEQAYQRAVDGSW